MADEVDLNELEGLMGSESVLPEVALALSTNAPAAGVDDEAERKRLKKERKREKREKREKRDKKEKRRRQEEDDDGDLDDEDGVKRSRYVLDAAESTDGDADDIIGDDDDDTELGFNDGPRFDEEEHRKRFIFHEGDHDKSADELGREFEERARMMKMQRGSAGAGLGGRGEGGHELRQDLSTLRYTARMMPGHNDPKVFAVRVQPRRQRVLVSRIVNKCYCQRTGQYHEGIKHDLGIISVFAVDRVKEYIYVEAWRKEFVTRALNGLVGVMLYDISVVEPTEVLQMLEKRPSTERVPVDAFVRLRQRFYKNDLAQVTAVHQNGVHVTVKVVPREDFVDKPYSKATSRLSPQFFVPARAAGVEDRGDHYRWGDLRFDRDGYLLRTVSMRMLIFGSKMEPPTTDELAFFFRNNRERVREAIQQTSEEEVDLHIGDTVRVISGQLRDTVGSLINVFENDKTVMLSCRIPGRAEPVKLRVERRACVKHFTEGTHVLVEKGDRAGESGTVIKSHGNTITIFLDGQSAVFEATVRANDCRQSKLVGLLSHTHGTWELFDLTTILDANTVACVTGLSKNEMTVLTEHNEQRTLTYAEVKAAAPGRRQTADPMQNIITRGCEVSVQRVPLAPNMVIGQTGRVEQVFNRVLFVSFRTITANAGLVAVDASCVLLRGGRTTMRQAAPPRKLPGPMRRPHNATRVEASRPPDSVDWESNSEWYEPSSMTR